MAEVQITEKNFEAEVTRSELPVLLDFYADWCGPCQMLSPTVAAIAKEYEGKVKVGRINVDDEPSLADAFRVTSIPLLVLMKNGRPSGSLLGYHAKEDIVKML